MKNQLENNRKEYQETYKDIREELKELKKENKELKSVKKECAFREDGTEECLWHCSNCNKEWLFYEGTPEDNELKYCPHCGAKVTKYENYIEREIEVANKMEEDLIEKLRKENEELKIKNNAIKRESEAYAEKMIRLDIEKQDYFEKYRYHLQQNESLTKEFSNVIPIQKVKDKIEEEIKYHEKNILDIENITMLKGKTAKEEAEIEFNKYVIVVLKKILQELIEEREEK